MRSRRHRSAASPPHCPPLGANYQVVERLEATEPGNLPVLVRFLLQTVPRNDPRAVATLIADLRANLQLSPAGDILSQGSSEGGGGDASSSGAALTLEAFRNGLRLRSDVAAAYLKDLTAAKGPQAHVALDLWFVFAMFTAPAFRPKVVKAVKAKALSGCLREAHLLDALSGHRGGGGGGAALAALFDAMASLAGELLRQPGGGGGFGAAGGHANLVASGSGGGGGKGAARFGGSLYLLLFLEFPDGHHRQKVVAALVAHVGSGNGREADAALQVFDDLLAPDADGVPGGAAPADEAMGKGRAGLSLPPRKVRVMALRPFAVFLKGMLDFVGSMSEANVRRLFRAFFILGDGEIDDREDEGGDGWHHVPHGPTPVDDVHIVVRKFLALSSPQARRHGVIGAVAFVTQRGAARQVRGAAGGAGGAGWRGSAAAFEDEETMLDDAGGGGGGAASQEFRTADLSAEAVAEVTQTFDLALAACHRDPALLGFLLGELARAVEADNGACGVHPYVVSSILSERFTGHLQVALHPLSAASRALSTLPTPGRVCRGGGDPL